jgi:hypothetical protein
VGGGDFYTDDRASEVSRLLGLGATQVAEHEVPGLQWTVLLDPPATSSASPADNGRARLR